MEKLLILAQVVAFITVIIGFFPACGPNTNYNSPLSDPERAEKTENSAEKTVTNQDQESSISPSANTNPKDIPALDGSIVADSGSAASGGSSSSSSGSSGGDSLEQNISGLAMSTALSLVTAEEDQQNAGSSSGFKTRKAGVYNNSFDAPESDYSESQSRFHVDMEALEPLDMANFIMCFIKQLAPSDSTTLNQGNYLALVNENTCETGTMSEDSQSGSDSAQQSTSYQSVVVNSTRASDSADQIVKVWVLDDGQGEIRAEAIVKAGISSEHPFGIFDLNWIEVDPSNNTIYGQGSLSALDKNPATELPLENNSVGLSFYMEATPRDDGSGEMDFDTLFGPGAKFVQTASAVLEPNQEGKLENGIALTQTKMVNNTGDEIDIEDRLLEVGNIDIEEFGIDSFSKTFAISYNNNNMLVQNAPLYDDLPFTDSTTPDPTSGTCYSRDEFDQAVWCYELFDAETGASLNHTQGFPFSVEKQNCERDEMWGYLGYWGMWYEGEHIDDQNCAISSGDIIERRDHHDNNSREDYEILKSKGKLMRHTVATLNLTNLSGVELETWSLPGDYSNFGDFGDDPDPYIDLKNLRHNQGHNVNSWLVNYLTIAQDSVASDGFYITGYKTWGDFGPEVIELSTISDPVGLEAQYDITPSRFEGEQLWLYSQYLGGSVRYTKDASFITYNTEEYIDPNDDIFGVSGDSNLALNCLFQCPKGNLQESDLDTYDGPYEDFVEGEGVTSTAYNFMPNNMMLTNQANQPIALLDNHESSGSYMWGLHSGPMVTADILGSLTNWWDVFNSPGSVYYTWETGTQNWNQAIFAKKVSNLEFASFDKPLEFSYTHETDNDRLDNNQFDQKTFLLGYGGKCNLWGIPWEPVGDSENHHKWYPSFGLKDGTLLGDSDQYVIKALEGEQLPRETPGECTGLAVSDPAISLPNEPNQLPSHALTAAPDMSNAAPLVIGGEVQIVE